MRSLIIFGGSGQLGRSLSSAFPQAKTFGHSTNVRKADITNYAALKEIFESESPEIVINAAALTNVDSCEAEKGKAYAVNSLGVKNISLLCREYSSKLIHFSTDYVFRENEGHYSEDSFPDPVNYYGLSKSIGDAKTIWYFRERLSKTGRDRIIWNELQRQLEMKGIKVKKGSARDAAFIISDPGHVKHDGPRSEGKARRSRDGSLTKKNSKTLFGYKGHTIKDDNHPVPFIRSYAVTTVKDHDTRIDLSKRGIIVYRDQGYLGMIQGAQMAQWIEL